MIAVENNDDDENENVELIVNRYDRFFQINFVFPSLQKHIHSDKEKFLTIETPFTKRYDDDDDLYRQNGISEHK